MLALNVKHRGCHREPEVVAALQKDSVGGGGDVF